MKKIKKIAVMTSGGDSPGMNAAIRSVVRACAYYRVSCVGVYRGYEGLIEGDFIELTARSVNNIINKGGTILKSARSTEFRTKEGRAKAFEKLKEEEIEALVVIGGDGSFTGAVVFNQEYNFPVIGIPGTIDNDIFGTESTIGYDTAINTAVDAIDKIRDTAASHERTFFVEVMGRDAGFIGVNTAIAVGAESVLIPEVYEDKSKLFSYFDKKNKREKLFSIVIVTEGNKEGNAIELANQVESAFPNLDIRVSVLGHIQRGGKPSAADRVFASKLGYTAVHLLNQGESGIALGTEHSLINKTSFLDASTKHNILDKAMWDLAHVLSL